MAFDQLIKRTIRRRIAVDKRRPDGRSAEEIRPIWCDTGIAPRTHGSGLFTRGETQVLTLLALGTMKEAQRIDDLSIDTTKRYIHHYNFPPFSVGETGFMRGPKRRDIGHGALAERALIPVIPPEEEFPYTLRLVSETLESNGSSSMASVCGSTLALLDAGVNITRPVAGIAMGLIKEGDDLIVLTDIQGDEDHLGDMDFKVAGTSEGVTALQMDNKVAGVTQETLAQALQNLALNSTEPIDLGTSPIFAGGRINETGTSFGMIVRALSTNSDVNLLSTPSITTMQNEEAKIVVGQTVPFRTGSTVTGSQGAANPFTTIQREDVGLTLEVTPFIHDGNLIRLKIHQEVSEVDPASFNSIGSEGASDLITNTRTIDTTILVDDREVIIIGGLIRDKETESASKVPLLGSIPLLPAMREGADDYIPKGRMQLDELDRAVGVAEDLGEVPEVGARVGAATREQQGEGEERQREGLHREAGSEAPLRSHHDRLRSACIVPPPEVPPPDTASLTAPGARLTEKMPRQPRGWPDSEFRSGGETLPSGKTGSERRMV